MTPEQQKRVNELVEIGKTSWAPMTEDPEVNWEVDRQILLMYPDDEYDVVPEWENADPAEKAYYIEEATLYANSKSSA